MERPTPGGVGGFGTLSHSFDEIDRVELDRERRTAKILAASSSAGSEKIDTVIMVDLGAGERLPHLAGVAASNIDKGERVWEFSQRGMKNGADSLRG